MCTPFVHRNINHSVCLVCISESFPPSKNNSTSSAAEIYRQCAACLECSYSSPNAKKKRRTGRQVWELQHVLTIEQRTSWWKRNCPPFCNLFSPNCYYWKQMWPPNLLALWPNVSMSFSFVYCHHGHKDCPCLPAFLTIPMFCVSLALLLKPIYA